MSTKFQQPQLLLNLSLCFLHKLVMSFHFLKYGIYCYTRVSASFHLFYLFPDSFQIIGIELADFLGEIHNLHNFMDGVIVFVADVFLQRFVSVLYRHFSGFFVTNVTIGFFVFTYDFEQMVSELLIFFRSIIKVQPIKIMLITNNQHILAPWYLINSLYIRPINQIQVLKPLPNTQQLLYPPHIPLQNIINIIICLDLFNLRPLHFRILDKLTICKRLVVFIKNHDYMSWLNSRRPFGFFLISEVKVLLELLASLPSLLFHSAWWNKPLLVLSVYYRLLYVEIIGFNFAGFVVLKDFCSGFAPRFAG